MLTLKQQELLSFIQTRLEEGGVSPSFEEMKDALDLRSKSGIHRLINALEERGFIRRLPNRARALEVLKLPDAMHRAPAPVAPAKPQLAPSLPIAANDVIEIPLHGRIAAGVPIEAMEGQNMLSVPAALLGAGDLAADLSVCDCRASGWIGSPVGGPRAASEGGLPQWLQLARACAGRRHILRADGRCCR